MRGSERSAVGALVVLATVTAAWWALALWPSDPATPQWLERARWVCFNAAPNGLPDASGWLLLIGQPIGMFAVLFAVWGDQLRAALRSGAAKAAVGSCVALLALGVAAGGTQLLNGVRESSGRADFMPPETYPRLDRDAPALSLIDQHGERIALDQLAGRPALVTFAFGDCQTICPAVVHEALAVQDQMRATPGDAVPRVVIVSLDPWRDTPGRLAHLAERWSLGDDAHVLSGSVLEVEAVLDGWNVARSRDPQTGDINHPALVYIVDAKGAIAFAARGNTAVMVELLRRV